jgi:uncharacterized surface protein with fasciclin (FAS1) repeats
MPSARSIGRVRGLAAAALIATLALTACGSDADEPGAEAQPAPANSSTVPSVAPSQNDAGPFGPACAGVPASGPGSLAAMKDQPVASAASQNPALSTLVSAVTAAGLVDTLNSTQDITIFAPTNEAFAKIPPDTLNKVLADKQTLTGILTYHVVKQRRTPAELSNAQLPTLQGGVITTAKSGDTYVANNARVVCGNVQTQNATVYLIDTVLMPT